MLQWRMMGLAAAAVLVVSVVLGIFWPEETMRIAAAYPAPRSTNVSVQTVIEVQFGQPVDQPAMAGTVRIEPAVPVEQVWQGNRLFLKPKEPLKPGTQYTVTVAPTQADSTAKAAVVTTFRTDEGPALAVMAEATPPAKAAAAGASPVATETAGLQAAANQGCAKPPVRGFGKVYEENVSVSRRLGCPTEQERGLSMAEQSFQHGHMLWRADNRTIYVLGSDGRWESYADEWQEGSAQPAVEAPPAGKHAPERGFGKVWREKAGLREGLGWAMAPERGFTGAAQGYEHGLMLWSDARWITVLYDNGTWERFPDTFVEPGTAPITPASTPASTPVAAVVATPMTDCSTMPGGEFGTLYNGEERLRQRLECAREEPIEMSAAEEAFQSGAMYWRGDIGQIYALYGDGTWASFADTFREGDPAAGGQTPPQGLVEPLRGFGKVWRENPQVRTKLGWATEGEHGFRGRTQGFAGGLMLLGDRTAIYVLYDGGRWERFGQ
jgi:hypothetical protein